MRCVRRTRGGAHVEAHTWRRTNTLLLALALPRAAWQANHHASKPLWRHGHTHLLPRHARFFAPCSLQHCSACVGDDLRACLYLCSSWSGSVPACHSTPTMLSQRLRSLSKYLRATGKEQVNMILVKFVASAPNLNAVPIGHWLHHVRVSRSDCVLVLSQQQTACSALTPKSSAGV